MTNLEIKEALRADDDYNVALNLEGWNDEQMKRIYGEVVDLVTPLGLEKDPQKVKITHTDNCENGTKFLDLYSYLVDLQPVKQVDNNIAVYETNGKRYATEYAEGGAYAVFYYEE